MKIDNAWCELDECIDAIAQNETKGDMECYNSGWQDGFVYALNSVIEAIDTNYNEADREGDDEYINERIAGWENVKNTINEMKESYLGE